MQMSDHAKHDHEHHDGHEHGLSLREISRRRLWLVLLINLAFLVIEFIGGIYAHSLALLADAGHMLTDVAALALALFVARLAQRPPTSKATFGMLRAEVLGAQINAATLFLISGLIIREAVTRFRHPSEVAGPLVLFVAVAGLAANLGSALILRKKHEENVNIEAAFLHMAADALGSVGAIISGIVIWTTKWYPIDPIVSLLICGLIVWGSWGLFKRTINILLESVPEDIDLTEVRAAIEAIPAVEAVHDLHIWTISSGVTALTGHFVLCAECCGPEHWEKCQREVEAMLHARFNINHTTLQFETVACEKECKLF
jgi:cobalt-zinc-cadmium efflux system protein